MFTTNEKIEKFKNSIRERQRTELMSEKRSEYLLVDDVLPKLCRLEENAQKVNSRFKNKTRVYGKSYM